MTLTAESVNIFKSCLDTFWNDYAVQPKLLSKPKHSLSPVFISIVMTPPQPAKKKPHQTATLIKNVCIHLSQPLQLINEYLTP